MRWNLWLAALAVMSGGAVNADLKVTSLDRQVDLSSQLVKIQIKLVLSNAGKSPVKSFNYVLEESEKDRVSFLGVSSGKSEKTFLRVMDTKLPQFPNLKAYKIDLRNDLKPGASETLEIDIVMGKALEMYPAEITQREKQLALFTGNHYAFLPYPCQTQTTKVTLPSSNLESYSKLKPSSLSDNVVTYGPYANVEPFSSDPMTLHYENNNPFLVVTKLERTLELSMWGNIAVEEIADVRHAGAKLKGSFSRYEYQKENSGVSAVKQFKTVLPASANGVYYRDDIGNISTSALRVMDDAVEVELRPRFPLFGGWKTHYVLGYNVPSYEYLYNVGDMFTLNMRLLDHIFDDMLVEDLTVKIILPEGAEVKNLNLPYPMQRGKDGLHFTYLDTTGRPVITLRNKGELNEKHIQDFQLEFKFPKTMMSREPLLLIAAFFTFFALAIVYVRLDFAISKDEGSEAKLKVAGYCEKVSAHHEKRVACYNQFDDALVRLKASKDTTAFQSMNQKISSDLKSETNAISELNNVLKNAAPDVGEKINNLQKADRSFREHQTHQALLVEKLVGGKLGKQQFIDQEEVILKKKAECIEHMNSSLASLRS